MKNKLFFIILLALANTVSASYPSHWWETVAESERQGSWEVLPHECKKGELVLSKRNELGVFSNFAASEFKLDGATYASVEGLWQMMKYPNPLDDRDPRNAFKDEYAYTRAEVKKLSGFTAKKAGDLANKVNSKHKISWVSYKQNKFDYKDHASGSKYHFSIISRAIEQKINNNPEAKKLLMSTSGLQLIPDHTQSDDVPPSYLYHKIMMKIRDQK